MGKYIKRFKSLSAAVNAQDLVSPNVSDIEESNEHKLLMINCGNDKEIQIKGNSLNDLVIEEKPEPDYLTFTCVEDGGISMSNYGGNTPNVEYRKNGGEWITWDYSNITLVVGDKIQMRGHNESGFSNDDCSMFVITVGIIEASGNIMTLIDNYGLTLNIPNGNCFAMLFYNCDRLTKAPLLPATTLTETCYYGMFWGCTRLTLAPALPATTLTKSCYYRMFKGCINLSMAPELPATTLSSMCYHSMFYGTNALPDCSNINFNSNDIVFNGVLRGLFAGTKITNDDLDRILPHNTATGKYWLPVTNLSNYCYEGMFEDCVNLTIAPELPATTLASHCYLNMFYKCINLISAPELLAETLINNCYVNMFNSCSNLNYIKCLATDIGSNTYMWVANVLSNGQFVAPKSMKNKWIYYLAQGDGKPTNFTYVDA